MHSPSTPEAPSIRRILVIVDPTADEQPAVTKAARIAAILGSEIELYVCDVEPSPSAELRELRHRGYLEDLELHAKPLRERGLKVTKICEWHAPLEQGIGYHVIRTRPDLVVKETHRHAQSDLILIAQLPAPLLLVRPAPWPEHPSIAVSVDPCHPADRPESLDQTLVSLGCLFANGLAGQLEAWHVLEAPPHLPGEPTAPIEITRVTAAARDSVARVVNTSNNRACAIDTHFLNGPVAAALATHASLRKPDLIMLGGAARPRWAQSAVSGTAAQLLEQLACDLLVVKPEGFTSPLLVHDEPE